jgi:hypothetical protein
MRHAERRHLAPTMAAGVFARIPGLYSSGVSQRPERGVRGDDAHSGAKPHYASCDDARESHKADLSERLPGAP